jgi:hypothetical protein
VNLIRRFIRFVVWVVLSLLLQLLLGLLVLVLRFVVWPLLVAILRLLTGLIFSSFTATVSGPRQYINRRAGEWTARIVQVVENRDHINEIYRFCQILVGATVVLGWLVSTLFTGTVLWVVFGFFN